MSSSYFSAARFFFFSARSARSSSSVRRRFAGGSRASSSSSSSSSASDPAHSRSVCSVRFSEAPCSLTSCANLSNLPAFSRSVSSLPALTLARRPLRHSSRSVCHSLGSVHAQNAMRAFVAADSRPYRPQAIIKNKSTSREPLE